MVNRLARYRIDHGFGPYADGNYIETGWDDIAMQFVVWLFENDSDNSPNVLTSGPSISAALAARDADIVYPPHVLRPSSYPIPYSYCDATTLVWFRISGSFPYVAKELSYDHYSCQLAVCDLQFTGNTVTPASDQITPDGTITVVATSSFGPIKFSFDRNFDYQASGQVSGVFNGLLPGDYIIYAKDAKGCFAETKITVGVPNFYNVKYRLQYQDLKGTFNRTDILQRGYTGDIIHVKGTTSPVVRNYEGDGINKFKPIIPSHIKVALVSEENFFFLDLFTQDDRKYKVENYRDYGKQRPPFTPAVMPAVSSWGHDSGGYDWFGLTFQLPGSGQSDQKYTPYAFEKGYRYKFAFQFTVVQSAPNPTNFSRIYIQITNAAGADLGATIFLNVGAGGAFSGTHEFTAPEGADRIGIKISQSVPYATYTINSFVNQTEPASGLPVGLELNYVGFVIPENYNETYLDPPYITVITATDGLADLKAYEFTDESGNYFETDITPLKAISQILKNTDLKIPIQSGINKFEVEMSGPADGDQYDPLNQCKFDPTSFYDLDEYDCETILTHILKPYGARILQRRGCWYMYCVEQAVQTIKYRQFDENGTIAFYGENDDLAVLTLPLMDNRAAFRDGNQVLEILPAYGKFLLDHELLKVPSLVASYSFEADDIYIDGNGITQLKNWNVDISRAAGASFGIKETKAFEGLFNFYSKIDRRSPDEPGLGVVSLVSKQGIIEYDATDYLEFRFSYAQLLQVFQTYSINPIWGRIKWMLQIGSFYYSEAKGGWTDDVFYKYNSIYVETFNESQNYKVVTACRQVSELTTEDFQIEFLLETGYTFDFIDDPDLTTMRQIPTVKLPIGYRIKGRVNYTAPRGETTFTYVYYQLVDDTSANDGIEVVRPDDFDEDDNPKLWQIDSEIWMKRTGPRGDQILKNDPVGEHHIQYNYIDNVVLNHLPNGQEPPETFTVEAVNNRALKINLEEAFKLADVDIENINNSEQTYKNYLKLLDGRPTQKWYRSYRLGEGKLLDLLATEYRSQYGRGTFKLTGNFDIDTEILPCSVIRETNNLGKKYMFTSFGMDEDNCMVKFDLAELVDVVNDPDSPDVDAEFSTDFNLDFTS
jgi:hypothetical protein